MNIMTEEELLNKTYTAISRGEDLSLVIRIIAEGAKALFYGHAATIYFFDEKTQSLVPQHWGLPRSITSKIEKVVGVKIRGLRFHVVDGGRYWQAIHERRAFFLKSQEEIEGLIDELASDHPAVKKLVPMIVRLLGYRTVFITPLVTADEIIGVIDVGSKKELGNEDLERFERLAGTLSVAITNARLLEKIRAAGKEAESARNLLADIFERISDGVVALDKNWHYTYVNRRAAIMLNRDKPEDLLGKHIWTEYPEGVGQPFYKAYYKAMEAQKPVYLEEYYEPWNRWFENSIYPSPDGLTIYFTEVTERVQAEQALRQETDRAQTYLDVAAVAMIALDSEGRITLVNRRGSEILGYSEGELLGKDWFATCIPERLRSAVRGAYKQLIVGEVDPVEDYENPILRKGGEERIIVWHNSVLRDNAGVITGTLSSGQDITKRVRTEKEKQTLEEQLRQGQKLESIGTLASGVEHEINNPLTGIINYADLIMEREKDPELRKFAQGIMKEGNRVADIVKSLLYFARQEKQSHSPARIEDIIDSSLTLVGAVLRKDQITVEKEIAPGLPKVRCRSQQIEQVIINLLTNARDALNGRYPAYHEDKLINIQVQPFKKDSIEWIRTTIEDHGNGISEDVIDRIFDPFFTTKERTQGTGLGLSVSYGIVKDHHGKLSVESKLGEYTRFHMDLRVNNGWTLG